MKSGDDELELEIRKLIAKIIDTDPQKITPDAHFIEDLGSDSMMALEMMAHLEKKFGVAIPEDELGKIVNLKEATKLIKSLLPDARK